MALQISGKQMNIGEALSQRIDDRIADAVDKYFDGGFSGQVTMEKTGSGFECDCTVHLDTGVVLQARANGHDATACFDDAAERIEKRLRRYKRRLKDHHPGSAQRMEAQYTVMASPDDEAELAEDYAPVVIAETSKKIMTLTVAQAVMQLDLTDNSLVIFIHAGNGRTNVVYRRSDGNIGWIDPENRT
jgi:ribosome hibernation promoting factor